VVATGYQAATRLLGVVTRVDDEAFHHHAVLKPHGVDRAGTYIKAENDRQPIISRNASTRVESCPTSSIE